MAFKKEDGTHTRQFKLDTETIARLDRLRGREREAAERTGVPIKDITFSYVVSKALKSYEESNE